MARIATHHLRSAVLIATLCGTLLLVSMQTAFASPIDYFNATILQTSGLPTDSPTQIALNILSAFLGLIGLIDVCFIIYAGFTMLTSGGNPEKVKHGRDTLIWAIVGSIIIFSALGLVLYLDTLIFAE